MGLDITRVGAKENETDHLFNAAYLRSSYNSAGWNSVLSNMGVGDLNTIFGPRDRYEFTPDWKAAKERALKAQQDFKAASKLQAFTQPAWNAFTPASQRPVVDSEAAIEIVRQEFARVETAKANGQHTFGAWSNIKGFFDFDGMEIVALVPGQQFGTPAVHAVFKMSDESLKWYERGFEILIDQFIAGGLEDNSELHWSG